MKEKLPRCPRCGSPSRKSGEPLVATQWLSCTKCKFQHFYLLDNDKAVEMYGEANFSRYKLETLLNGKERKPKRQLTLSAEERAARGARLKAGREKARVRNASIR